MEDDEVPDTRVFVSGLPPNFASDQLGGHFAKRYQITDAVVVPGRRIGFVGFRNYTLAQNAVKYFDKSYIRMSKISVEIAKPIEVNRDGRSQAAPVSQKASKKHRPPNTVEATPTSHLAQGTSGNPASSSFQPYVPLTATSNKRKRDDDRVEKQENLVDVLDYRQASTPKHTWSHEANAAAAREDMRSHSAQTVTVADTAEGISKKQKKRDKKSEREQNAESGISGQRDSSSTQKTGNRGKPELAHEAGLAAVMSSDNTPTAKSKNVTPSEGEYTSKTRKKHKAAASDNVDYEANNQAEHKLGNPTIQKKKELKSSKQAKGGVDSFDDASGLNEDDADRSQPVHVQNDSDWLRARTSRVLDLVDDDDDEVGAAKASALSKDKTGSRSGSAQDTEAPIPVVAGVQHDPEQSVANGRLFIRNLPYSAGEGDIQELFSKYGKVLEVHLVQKTRPSSSKGIAYVQFGDSISAGRALQQLDGAPFQGRLLHILPALDKRSHKLDDYEISKLPLKKQKEIKRKREAASFIFSWNSLYMNPDAVLSSTADRLGVTKAELLDPTSSDAAVKQAHAETHVLQETKSYLTAKGVNVDAFHQPSRDETILLVKNFPFGVTTGDLRQLFEPHGRISRLLMPPAGTMAIVQYSDARDAANALRQLAYKNLKGSVLFLEKGPRGLFDQEIGRRGGEGEPPDHRKDDFLQPAQTPGDFVGGNAPSTLFVRNLNFATSSARLTEAFEPLTGFLSARVKTKIDPKRPGEILSMGFGFVDFRTPSEAQAARSVMNGYRLDNHDLAIEASHRATDAAEERRRDDIGKKLEAKKTKVVIKNLPFEASKKDVRALVGAYGQLRSVRLPKKFDNSTRGFAFADFVSAKEAENAIAALKNTHLLGRRLVLEFASGDAMEPEQEILAMEQRVSRQTNIVNLSKMTGSGRTKFTVDARDDEDP